MIEIRKSTELPRHVCSCGKAIYGFSHETPFILLHIIESSTIETDTVCGMENRLVWGSVKKEYTE